MPQGASSLRSDLRHETRRQIALRLHHAGAAAEFPGAGRRVVAHLVAVADQRQVHAEVFQRIVAPLRISSSTVSGPSDSGRPPIAASLTSRNTQSPEGRTPE